MTFSGVPHWIGVRQSVLAVQLEVALVSILNCYRKFERIKILQLIKIRRQFIIET